MKHPRPVVALLIPIALVAVGCGGSSVSAGTPSPGASSGALASAAPAVTAVEQVNEGGSVTVKASWGGPTDGLAFSVVLDTHSVDLDALDLRNAALRNDRGETVPTPSWDAPKGGHHRTGRLTFEGDSEAFLGGAKWIELVIPDVAGIPARTLRWQVAA